MFLKGRKAIKNSVFRVIVGAVYSLRAQFLHHSTVYLRPLVNLGFSQRRKLNQKLKSIYEQNERNCLGKFCLRISKQLQDEKYHRKHSLRCSNQF